MLKVYLAGSTDEVEYREYMKQKYGSRLKLFDPLENDPGFTYMQTVEVDKEMIKNSDVLIAYVRKYTAGTMMEILFAYMHQISVYLIDPSKTFRNDIWLKYHCDIFFDSIDLCAKHCTLRYAKYD